MSPKFTGLLGQISSHRQQARGVLDRARKRLHRASYWKALAGHFPLLGHSSTQIADMLANPVRAPNESGTHVLPGLQTKGGQLYYWNHPLPRLGSEDLRALKTLLGASHSEIHQSLLDTGLVVQTAMQCSPPPKAQALVLSPHQDDAALSIGGTIVARRELESHVICNVFTVSGWLGKGFRPSPLADVTQIRQSEEDLSNRVLGATGLGLGLWEAEVANYYRRAVDNYPTRIGFVFADDPHLRTLGERDSIHRGISQVVQSLSPSRIYFPLGLGSHMDHVYLARYGTEQVLALRQQYPDSDIYFFEDLPYATYDETDVEKSVQTLCGTAFSLKPQYQNITECFETKIQSIAAHRSQFARDENQERLRRYAEEIARKAGLPPGYLAERIWRVA